MVVCHCTAINDVRIRLHLDEDITVDEVTARCGAGSRCGGCRETIQALIDEHRGRLVTIGASYSCDAG